ncbi:MAG: multicopper oxidase domain-containing protein [Gemmatimonadota bacterium]
MNRRRFLHLAGAAGALAACDAFGAETPTDAQELRRTPLPRPQELRANGVTLRAGPTSVDTGIARGEAWTLNGALPAPTLRMRRGERVGLTLENGLPEETILHWHGLDVPEAADGHPRLAIPPGSRYDYAFDVRDRAGLYWYHPHTHMRTGAQTYRGMAGLLVVEDEEESALGLPSGDREIPLVLQDRRASGGAPLEYRAAGMGPDRMIGYLGDTPFANGVAHATTTVARGTYRLRILNASNARIFQLGLSDGRPLTLIGTDGGLLERPASVERVMVATGERIDVLADFSSARPGDRIYLRSFAFEIPGMMGMGRGMGRGMGGMIGGMMGGLPQGAAMDLLELVVEDGPAEPAFELPDRLSGIPERPVDGSTPSRSFRFESMMMNHTINGRTFEMERVDARVPLGRTEVWTIENPSQLPHPVHVHAGQLRVRSRTGGRGRVMPWETGLKDTVLVLPGERVEVVVRFEEHRGLFLVHCHNLEHEDMGMMLNFQVE